MVRRSQSPIGGRRITPDSLAEPAPTPASAWAGTGPRLRSFSQCTRHAGRVILLLVPPPSGRGGCLGSRRAVLACSSTSIAEPDTIRRLARRYLDGALTAAELRV